MPESLAFDVFAIDRASEVFRRVGEHAEEMGSRMGKVAKGISAAFATGTLAVVAGAAVVAKAGIEELKSNQLAVAQLNAVITSTGGAAGVTSAKMQQLSKTIQDYSGQTHESVQQSEALLLGFTNIRDAAGKGNDVLSRATTLTADMAARMGGSASDNAVKLGKALNDPINGLTSLTRVGVQFTAAQKLQIKAMVDAGNTAGAQKLILDQLTIKYGGAAKAAGETLPGQMARAKLAFADVSASIMEKLLPVLTKLIGFVNDKVIPGLQALAQKYGPAVKRIYGEIADEISQHLVPAVKAFAEKEWPKVRSAFETFVGIVKKDVVPLLRDLQAWWGKNGGAIEKFIGQVVDHVFPVLEKVYKIIVPATIHQLKLFVDILERVVNVIMDVIHFGEKAAGVVEKIGKSAGGILGGAAKAGGGILSFVTGHNAGGTDNWPGGLSWVGEQGPELVNLPGGSQVIPNGRSMAMASGGGGGDIVINNTLLLDGQVVHRNQTRVAQEYKRRNGTTGYT